MRPEPPCVRRPSALALRVLALVALAPMSATANDLSAADDRAFQQLNLRTRALADTLAAGTGRPTNPDSATGRGLDDAVARQNCRLRLAENFDSVKAGLDHISEMVGLASRLVDESDVILVNRVLVADASGFLKHLQFNQQMLDLTVRKCPQDQVTLAEDGDIAKLYSDSAAQVKSIIAKIGASDLSR